MKIILMILLATCMSLVNSDYPRFHRKSGPQGGPPPRSPPHSQFIKKWGKPAPKIPAQYAQNRPYQGATLPNRGNRPGKPPMHKMQPYNRHIGQMQHPPMPQYQQFPQSPKKPKIQQAIMKDYFNKPAQNPQKIKNIHHVSAQIPQFAAESKLSPKIAHKPEKPMFISSPSIPSLEYDYHLQTNAIPMAINTIKQVGEKGPIHTIPAPNLTPADKPVSFELRQPQRHIQKPEVRFQQPHQHLHEQSQLNHQYQVTERNEQTSKPVFRGQVNAQTYYPPQSHINQQQNVQLYGQNNLGLQLQETGNRGITIDFTQPQQEQGQEDLLLSNSQSYQVNADFSAQPPQNLHTQAIQSSYNQQQPQILTQFLQEDYNGQQLAEDKNLNVHPEYHSFNYDEQAHQAQAKSGQSSGFVTAKYTLGTSEDVASQTQNTNSRSSPADPLTQAQIVQSYFNTRSGNDVEPDAKPSGYGSIEKEIQKNPFFSSLPNKEAADRLANLQAAGKVNSNLMQIGSNNRNQNEKDNDGSIYIPDESAQEEQDGLNNKEQLLDYEDYASLEEDDTESDGEVQYGQKITLSR